MNNMEKVAEMLDVKYGEQFKIKGREQTYSINGEGLYTTPSNYYRSTDLVKLISGELEIDRPWRPTYGDNYYCIAGHETPVKEQWLGNTLDILNYKTGNCFQSAEEAWKYQPQILSMLESKEVLFNVK